jgi:RNA polymerase sigma-70 factor (ECF subfamily)
MTTLLREDDRQATEDAADLDRAAALFVELRPRLTQVAYRVTGDAAGAEDVVQDAWLRWQRTDRQHIHNPAAFLTTTVTHLAISVIQSARRRRETPTAEVPVERMVTRLDPASRLERVALVEETVRLLLRRLTPAELSAYLLRKAFDAPYVEIATLLHTSTANSRQLVRRAQVALDGGRERTVEAAPVERLVEGFLTAADTGRLGQLHLVLTEVLRQRRRAEVERLAA